MFKKIGIGVGVMLVIGAAVALFQWDTLKAKYDGQQFRTATTDDARTTHLQSLLKSGEPGAKELLAVLHDGTPEQCRAVVVAFTDRFNESGDGDPVRVLVLNTLQAQHTSFNEAGQQAALDLVPELLKHAGPGGADCSRKLIQQNLTGPTEAKTRAARLAMLPGVQLQQAVVVLLDDPDAGVRQAAMTVVGPGRTVETEDLFRHLNDTDPTVRLLCEASLSSRGLDTDQIEAGRQLTSTDVNDRLQLITRLHRNRKSAEFDIGPWLERLSRDAEPAVRAAAARVGFDSSLAFAPWLDHLANDPDATVRQIVAFHKAAKSR
jgi:hypothetical protein